MKKRKIIIPAIVSVLVLFLIVSVIIIKNPYKPGPTALEALKGENEKVAVEITDDYITFSPTVTKATRGLIFYPGGFVECGSYAPLMEKLAEEGILCVIVRMPENLAFLDSDKAEMILEENPYIVRWYLGGHSLGGAMAASYISENYEKYEGLILLAAYSTEDLSDTDLKILSLHGTQDGVINRNNLTKYKANLGDDAEIEIIKGGTHAYFGDYGNQRGDGHPAITREEQIEITKTYILDLING